MSGAMIFGLTEDEYALIERLVVEPLGQLGVRVWCFGSRARGDHRPASDLDLLVEAHDDVKGKLFEISEDLIESDFPYKVDLVDQKSLAKSYGAQIERERVLLSPRSRLA
jgi:predicted nucleotidyltransferase